QERLAGPAVDRPLLTVEARKLEAWEPIGQCDRRRLDLAGLDDERRLVVLVRQQRPIREVACERRAGQRQRYECRPAAHQAMLLKVCKLGDVRGEIAGRHIADELEVRLLRAAGIEECDRRRSEALEI